jgi:tetratricopeptide (TPR) repeat protein
MYVPRLLRRTDDLAFDGIVHESVRAWLLRHGNRVWDVGTDILHYGAVASLRTARGKASRNTLLLEKRLSLEPDDFTVHGYLAHEYVAAAEPEKARAIVDQGWELMKRASPNTLRSALRLLAARALIQLQEGDADAALASVNDAIAYEGEGPDALFFRGRAYELKAQTSEGAVQEAMLTLAERAYRGCFAWADRVVAQRFVRGASSWCGRTRLATVRLLRGDAAEALE